MFPKKKPGKDEIPCPYDGTAYSEIPGYVPGRGCPVCKAISFHHLPISKNERSVSQDK